MTEFGNLALVEEREERQGGNVAIRLPGVRSGDMAARVFKPEVRVCCLQFSPTGNYIFSHINAHCSFTTLYFSFWHSLLQLKLIIIRYYLQNVFVRSLSNITKYMLQ